jgi:CDP-diacylglycerol---glycerol-3-phosphate 3-phosphatidyltransferase
MNASLQSFAISADLLFLLCFSAVALIPFATYIILWLLGLVSLPPAKEEGAGRRLLGPLFVGFFYWALSPFLRLARRTGLSPNHFALASLVLCLPAGFTIATGHFALASVLLVLGSTLDVVDGYVARDRGMVSKAGAFLDSSVDRVCDGMILGGFAVYYAGTPTMIAALVALVMSFTTSYARARGEALGISGSEGLIQRADRLVILTLALALSPYLAHRMEGFVAHPSYAVAKAALWLLALLSTLTAVTRVAWISNQLLRRHPSARSVVPSQPKVASTQPMRKSASRCALTTTEAPAAEPHSIQVR